MQIRNGFPPQLCKLIFKNMAKIKRNKPGNGSGIIKQVGSENYMVKDTPCLIPKENMKMFVLLRTISSARQMYKRLTLWS